LGRIILRKRRGCRPIRHLTRCPGPPLVEGKGSRSIFDFCFTSFNIFLRRLADGLSYVVCYYTYKRIRLRRASSFHPTRVHVLYDVIFDSSMMETSEFRLVYMRWESITSFGTKKAYYALARSPRPSPTRPHTSGRSSARPRARCGAAHSGRCSLSRPAAPAPCLPRRPFFFWFRAPIVSTTAAGVTRPSVHRPGGPFPCRSALSDKISDPPRSAEATLNLRR